MSEYFFWLLAGLDLESAAQRRWEACVVRYEAVACDRAQREWLEAGNAVLGGSK